MNKHTGIKLSLCAAALAVAFPVSAQEAPKKTGDDITEVVITASKRKESIQSVPMSVDAITSEALQKMNVQKFEDVQKLSPGLVLNAADGRGQNVALRGVTFDPDTGASPTVQVYWNETTISTSDAFRSMFDIGRIEVLRGPQGTLRGQTSPAGAITVATRQPNLSDVEGTVSQTFGSRSLWNTQAALNVPLIEGKLAMRVAGVYDQSKNGVHNLSNGRDNSDRSRGGRISLLYQPLKDLDILLVHQDLTNKNVNYPVNVGAPVPGQGNQPTLTADDRASLVDGNYDFHNRARLTSLNVNWNFAGHKLSYIGGFQQSKETDDRDLDVNAVIPGHADQQLVRIDGMQRTHEVRIESTANPFWNYMFGTYYAHNTFGTDFTQPYNYYFPAPYAAPLSFPLHGYSAPGTYSKGKAVFTDQRWALSANDMLEAGLRLQKNQSYSQQYISVAGNVSPSLPEPMAHLDTKRWTSSASYKHNFSKDLMTYVSYSGGYRAGGAVGFVTVQGLDPNYIVFKPEKTNSIELGFKSKLLDRKLTLNANVFQQKIKDYIARANGINVRTGAVAGEAAGPGAGGSYPADAGTGGINLNTNGDVIARGIEATAIWSMMPGWKTQLSVSYVDAHYDNAMLYCNDGDNDGIPDNKGAFVQPGRQVSLCRSNGPLVDGNGNEPGKLSMVLQSEYARNLGRFEGFVRGLLRYNAAGYNQPLNQHVASFTPLDLYLGVRDPGQTWELSLWSQNLFDRSVVRNNTPSYLGGLAGGYTRISVPEERKVGVTLRYDFD